MDHEMLEAMKELLKPIVGQIQVMNQEIQTMNREIQIMKEEIQIMKEEIQVVKEEIQVMKEEIQVMKEEIQEIKQEIRSINSRLDKVEKRTNSIQLTLENETNRKIDVIGDGHDFLKEGLEAALGMEKKRERMELDILNLRIDMRKVKEKLDIA